MSASRNAIAKCLSISRKSSSRRIVIVFALGLLMRIQPVHAVEHNVKPYKIWLPDALAAGAVRGVFVHRTYSSGDSVADNPTWRTHAERLGFGHAVIPQEGKQAPQSAGQLDLPGYDTFMRKAAAELKHPELVSAKVIAVGISNAGGIRSVSARALPSGPSRRYAIMESPALAFRSQYHP